MGQEAAVNCLEMPSKNSFWSVVAEIETGIFRKICCRFGNLSSVSCKKQANEMTKQFRDIRIFSYRGYPEACYDFVPTSYQSLNASVALWLYWGVLAVGLPLTSLSKLFSYLSIYVILYFAIYRINSWLVFLFPSNLTRLLILYKFDCRCQLQKVTLQVIEVWNALYNGIQIHGFAVDSISFVEISCSC